MAEARDRAAPRDAAARRCRLDRRRSASARSAALSRRHGDDRSFPHDPGTRAAHAASDAVHRASADRQPRRAHGRPRRRELDPPADASDAAGERGDRKRERRDDAARSLLRSACAGSTRPPSAATALGSFDWRCIGAVMRILVCNDDGIMAPGLTLLAEAARAMSDDVWVVAPERKWTAAGHQLSFDRDLTLARTAERVYACSGAPADCVVAAMTVLFEGQPRPDLVL